MGAVPRSLRTAVADLALLAAAAFAACFLVTGPAMQRDLELFIDQHGFAYGEFQWGWVREVSKGWTLAVIGWVAIVWFASRSRSGRRTVWLPAAAASFVVLARSAVLFAPTNVRPAVLSLWPGAVAPLLWDEETGTVRIVPGHPAWAFPVLVIVLFAGAAWLGARAGQAPDDRTSRHVAAPSAAGVAFAGVVVGLPALGGCATAAVAFLAAHPGGPQAIPHRSWALVVEMTIPLLTALLAAALLSGTGLLGVLGTAAAGLSALVPPSNAWLSGGPDPSLAQVAGAALAVVTVALWRPAALWGAEILAPARVGAPLQQEAGEQQPEA